MKVFPILVAFLLLVHQGAAASDLSLAGTWNIVSATAAPWLDEGQRKAAEASGKRLLKLELKFAAKEVISKDRVLGCKSAVYEPTEYPADVLFQGMLPEPNQERLAQDMGFKRGEVPGVDVRCRTGVFSYHFVDRDTAMFAFNNVLYIMKRYHEAAVGRSPYATHVRCSRRIRTCRVNPASGHANPRHLTCARCSTSFVCGAGGRQGGCWCEDAAFRLPTPTSASEDCMCTACLHVEAARQTGNKSCDRTR